MELLETKNNIDKMYHLLLKYGLIRSNNPGRAIPVGAVETKPFAKLRWNNAKKGERITLENDSTLVFLKEQGYTFRSAFGNHGFIKGAHYWEIIADKRTENELKIGIAVRPHETFNLDTAFCDDQCGFAFYG